MVGRRAASLPRSGKAQLLRRSVQRLPAEHLALAMRSAGTGPKLLLKCPRYWTRVPSQTMPSRWFASALFLSSYAPAWLILAVRSYQRSCVLFWTSIGLAIASAGAFVLFIRLAREGGPFEARVDDVEPRDAELAAYVATYLLPFVVVFGANVQDVIALGMFLAFIGLLWVNSDMVYLNPLLTALGYHVYVVGITPIGGASHRMSRSFLLSHQADLRPGARVRPDTIGRNVYIDLTPRRHGRD
jgi:hypothetical protein